MSQRTGDVDDLFDDALEGLSPPCRDFLLELLLYKSTFTGSLFDRLGQAEALKAHRDVFSGLSAETREQARAVVQELRAWDSFPDAAGRLDAAMEVLRARLFKDLLELKAGSAEVFLAAAMRAPTLEIRRHMLELADVDRRHADALRAILGGASTRRLLARRARLRGATGAHEGRVLAGSLSESIRHTVHALEASGAHATGVCVGPTGLRHLRDEGAVDTSVGTLFGLPVEVDLGWADECFCVATEERATLAELVTAQRQGADPIL